MGKKGRWFDTVQRILSTSEPDPVETQTDAKERSAKLRDKPSFKKIWQFGRSNSSSASTSAAPAAELPQSPTPDTKQHAEVITEKVQFLETRCESERMHPAEVVSPASKANSTPAPMAAAAAARPTVISPTTWFARSKEDIAATRIQAACRGHLARKPQQERGMARLMLLVNEGFAVKRQTEEALYCMQMMTRIQTQVYSRRLKTEDDKKALKSHTKVKQSLDKTIKSGDGWDHSLQSKEQMEAVLKMKQEAASRRQRALSYAFSQQWRNRNTSSARATHAPAPRFMNPGNPNWGWSWTERWMAAARPWEDQTAAPPADTGRVASSKSGRSRLPRVAVSVQIPTTTTTTPKGKSSFRPPNWPSSLSSPSTPPARSSPLISLGRTTSLASPRSGPSLHATSGLQHAKSLPPDRRPRSSQELSVNSPRRAVPASPRGAASRSSSPLHASSSGMQLERRPRSSQELSVKSPRCAVPASPRGAGSGSSSPLHASSHGMPFERRPRSSQELSVNSPRRGVPASPRGAGSGSSSPLHASSHGMPFERRPRSSQSQDRGMSSSPRVGAKVDAPLRRTTSLRAELPRRLSLGNTTAAASMGDDEGAPVTPSYMTPTKSVKAKVVRCPSPWAALATSSDMFDAPAESGPAPVQVPPPSPTPSSAKKRLPLPFADKPSASSSPSKAALERVRRHTQLSSSPRKSLS